jgi:hypothetical protein
LAPDTAAITGSPESAAAAAPAPTKLTKSLRFNVVLTPLIIDEQHRQKRACDQWRCSTKYSVHWPIITVMMGSQMARTSI